MGIHLAVIDMLNKNFDDFIQPIESPLLEEVNNIKDENGSEGQQEYMGFDEESLSEDEEESIEEYGIYFDDIMKKVRKIIKTFKYSPKNYGFLQAYFFGECTTIKINIRLQNKVELVGRNVNKIIGKY